MTGLSIAPAETRAARQTFSASRPIVGSAFGNARGNVARIGDSFSVVDCQQFVPLCGSLRLPAFLEHDGGRQNRMERARSSGGESVAGWVAEGGRSPTEFGNWANGVAPQGAVLSGGRGRP